MSIVNFPQQNIYSNQYMLTSGAVTLISVARSGRTLYAQVSGTGTAMIGDVNMVMSNTGIVISGSLVFNDYTSAAWYAIGVGGNATLSVLEVY